MVDTVDYSEKRKNILFTIIQIIIGIAIVTMIAIIVKISFKEITYNSFEMDDYVLQVNSDIEWIEDSNENNQCFIGKYRGNEVCVVRAYKAKNYPDKSKLSEDVYDFYSKQDIYNNVSSVIKGSQYNLIEGNYGDNGNMQVRIYDEVNYINIVWSSDLDLTECIRSIEEIEG